MNDLGIIIVAVIFGFIFFGPHIVKTKKHEAHHKDDKHDDDKKHGQHK